MYDDTGTVEVAVCRVLEEPTGELKLDDGFSESLEMRGDGLYHTTLSVESGERFAICVALDESFDFHDNNVVKIVVAIDGTAIRIVHYLNAKATRRGPRRRRQRPKRGTTIDRVRARTKMTDPHQLTNISWHALVFGELHGLETSSAAASLPDWVQNVDSGVITVSLELGHLRGEKGPSRAINHGPDAHRTKTIELREIGKADPVKTRTDFFPDKYRYDNSPITFKFHYTPEAYQDETDKMDCDSPQPVCSPPRKPGKQGTRRPKDEDPPIERFTGFKPPIPFKTMKQDPVDLTDESLDGVINPLWFKSRAAGHI